MALSQSSEASSLLFCGDCVTVVVEASVGLAVVVVLLGASVVVLLGASVVVLFVASVVVTTVAWVVFSVEPAVVPAVVVVVSGVVSPWVVVGLV